MKNVACCLFVLLVTTFVLSGHGKAVIDSPNALSVKIEDVVQLPIKENNTDTEQFIASLDVYDSYRDFLSKASSSLFPKFDGYSNDVKPLTREKRFVGRLLGRLFKGVVRLLRGNGSRQLKRITPKGNPRKTTRSGGRTTYHYDKSGGVAQANRDFNRLKPKNIRTIQNGRGRVGNVGEFTVNVREVSSEGRPTLEYFKTGARTDVVKIRYTP